jgi:hypothetical protein
VKPASPESIAKTRAKTSEVSSPETWVTERT